MPQIERTSGKTSRASLA